MNGTIVTSLGREVVTDIDQVFFDGKPVSPPKSYRYILMNKPKGVITSLEDSWGRRTVIDLIEPGSRVFPVGRLDLDTEGVLLLTNDGELAYRLSHPKYRIDKVYEVTIDGSISFRKLEQLNKGVNIGNQTIVRGKTDILEKRSDQTILCLNIHEGKKRQIKRMMKAIGHPVIKLKRICFAGLTLTTMGGRIWRNLEAGEVARLYQLTGLSDNQSLNYLRSNK